MANCSNTECAAHKTKECHVENPDYRKCEFWLKTNGSKAPSAEKIARPTKKQLPWSGEAMSIDELNAITGRNIALTLGIVGRADAGKTTFLAMLFTLLQKGYGFEGFEFAGSNTIVGWDYLYDRLKIYQTQVSFPDPTPLEYCRFFHLALKDQQAVLKDILISDASGEVFTLWATDRDHVNAENARLIYRTSSAFILFIDCEDLIERRGRGKADIIKIAEMLKYDLRNRPVVAVWSKSDKKSEVYSSIKLSIDAELQSMFPIYEQIDISNFSSSQPDPLVHANNLKVIDWLLNVIAQPIQHNIILEKSSEYDFFLNYRDNE